MSVRNPYGCSTPFDTINGSKQLAAVRSKPYPTDLTEEEWLRVHPIVRRSRPLGRKRTVDMRGVVNAVLYRLRSRCPWRMLPHEFPPWETVYYYYRRWSADGTLDIICAEVRR